MSTTTPSTTTTTSSGSTSRITHQRLSLNSGMFYEAVKTYIEEMKPDPLSRRQLEGWVMEWTEEEDITTTTSGTNESATSNKIPNNDQPVTVIDGRLTISGEYVQVTLQMGCSWKTYHNSINDSDDDSNNNNINSSSSCCNDGELLYSCQVISARILKESIKHRGGTSHDDSANNDVDVDKTQKRIRERTIERLSQDSYITKLLQLQQQQQQKNRNPNDDDDDDDRMRMVLAKAEIRVCKSQNVLEERVDVTETVAEALRRALWSSTESSLDMVEVILALPSLPCTTGGSSTTTITATTPLANRAKLRLLEDAMLDACEREGEDQLIEDLDITSNNKEDTPKGGEEEVGVEGHHHTTNTTRPTSRRKKAKFDIHAMALMVMMTLLLTSNAFTFQSMPSFMTRHLHSTVKKPSQGTATIASTKRYTQQLLMSSIVNQKPRKCSAHNHSWQQRYLELKEFHQKFGHTDVPTIYPDNPQLGSWVATQRRSYKKGKLTVEQIQDLVDIGFHFDSHNAAWERRYLELKEFSQKFGHTDVPRGYPANPQLGHWVNTQRKSYKKGKLTDKKIQALVDIGFQWGSDHTCTDWDQRYLEVKEFHQKFGHTDVPQEYSENPQLGFWVMVQRRSYKKGKLTVEQIQDLVDIGFHFDSYKAAWERRYLELKEYRQKFGHADVPQIYDDNLQLGRWVSQQRTKYKKGKLTAEQIQALKDINFIWEVRKVRRTKILGRYIPLKLQERETHSRTNSSLKRINYMKGKLTVEQIQDLVDIGFHFDSHKAAWGQMYFELKEFSQKFGHTRVPQIYYDNLQLGRWVNTQRKSYKKGKLTAEQIQALVDIDFIWEVKKVRRRRTKILGRYINI